MLQSALCLPGRHYYCILININDIVSTTAYTRTITAKGFLMQLRHLFFSFISMALLSTLAFSQSLSSVPAQKLAQPGKPTIALMTIKNTSGVDAGEAEIISDRLRGELFNTGMVEVMEREQMQEILKEQGFQASGVCTDEECLVKMGHILGVQKLVTGSIGKLGSKFLINIRSVDVQTARIDRVVKRDISGSIDEVVDHLPSIAEELTKTAQPQKATSIAAVETRKNEETAQEKEESEAESKPEVVVVVNEKKKEKGDNSGDRNKNRSGIRLHAALSGPTIKISEHWDTTASGYYNQPPFSYDTITFTKTNLLLTSEIGIDFLIRLGQLFTLDIGINYIGQQSSFTRVNVFDTAKTWKIASDVYALRFGPTFVKRIHAIKINAGLIIDVGLSLAQWDYSESLYGYSLFTPITYDFVGGQFGFGGKIGAEYLIGKHFGIGADLKFERSAASLIVSSSTPNYDYPNELTFQYPSVWFDFSATFYF